MIGVSWSGKKREFEWIEAGIKKRTVSVVGKRLARGSQNVGDWMEDGYEEG